MQCKAWHKGHNKFYEVIGIYPKMQKVQLQGIDNLIPLFVVEILWYTGYEDIKHESLYAGDIVDFRRGEKNMYICFHTGQWCLCEYIGEPNKNYRHLDHYVKHDGPIRKLGNIYSNPELMDNNKKHKAIFMGIDSHNNSKKYICPVCSIEFNSFDYEPGFMQCPNERCKARIYGEGK